VKFKDGDTLLQTLKARFGKNVRRHPGIAWDDVRKKIEGSRQVLGVLGEMEASGGEPDVVAGLGRTPRDLVFCDCSPESPAGRRSTCYDAEARKSRKEHAPKSSAIEMAVAMGIELLTEAQYRHLQTLGAFDLKTSSWIQTPADVRSRGGALFCDRRYDTVFVYHNGVQSYYAARGFRGLLRL
jgi:hypothetical protein